ncbi:MAG TPA: 3-isopropylmalate dehydratase small subunit [Burkholderiales bacterium]|nr:3-isopropylmalate dehydratase small subunit [Burkholderiales bacterium]
MEHFVRIKALAAPLLRPNVDTDVIIPSREITSPSREGFGEKLFASWRYLEPDRRPNPDFVLNRVPFDRAQILIAGENFGCGSSREMAVWAIRQFGFRCVIAPSFGAIFQANCYRNGVLPVVLTKADVEALGREAEAGALELEVDLEACTVAAPGDRVLAFAVGRPEREMLLAGLDAIGLTLKRRDEIAAFQARDRAARPWIWSN